MVHLYPAHFFFHDFQEVNRIQGFLPFAFTDLINRRLKKVSCTNSRYFNRVLECEENTRVRVTISDTGQGIDEEIRQRLFTPFATSKHDGMGLGLSISEGIINEHGGKLVLASSSEQGTEFQFTLPVINENE